MCAKPSFLTPAPRWIIWLVGFIPMLLSSLRIVSFGIVGHTFDIIILLSGLKYLLILIGFSLIVIGVGLLTTQSTSSIYR